jgi:hypothetical protein
VPSFKTTCGRWRGTELRQSARYSGLRRRNSKAQSPASYEAGLSEMVLARARPRDGAMTSYFRRSPHVVDRPADEAKSSKKDGATKQPPRRAGGRLACDRSASRSLQRPHHRPGRPLASARIQTHQAPHRFSPHRWSRRHPPTSYRSENLASPDTAPGAGAYQLSAFRDSNA